MPMIDIIFLSIVVSALVIFAIALAYADSQTSGRL